MKSNISVEKPLRLEPYTLVCDGWVVKQFLRYPLGASSCFSLCISSLWQPESSDAWAVNYRLTLYGGTDAKEYPEIWSDKKKHFSGFFKNMRICFRENGQSFTIDFSKGQSNICHGDCEYVTYNGTAYISQCTRDFLEELAG